MVNSDPPVRRARGFQRAGRIVAPELAAAARRRGFSEARLLTAWPEIAGPDIAAATRPVKMSRPRGGAAQGRGGTLTIEADGARAPEIQMMLPVLVERINAALGFPAVARIQLLHGWGFAEPAAPFRGPAPRPSARPAPDPRRLDPLLRSASSIGDDGLRTALETLARNVVSRAEHERHREPTHEAPRVHPPPPPAGRRRHGRPRRPRRHRLVARPRAGRRSGTPARWSR
jgi:hypothetical protein